ncbi:hypothetical protein EGR_04964 [Echinococcus granulosus]|uniref:Uncharacterized protein n=1 Tax=Echinococcus granulosus TaxID=6210 RepID=W6UGK8_ECHGR|nr:hypothetical protein EGR_04964 [Echinococcus granulosus]EUB60111.1 hypothetical protein EGR_04964 [Echinococcus granulosus]
MEEVSRHTALIDRLRIPTVHRFIDPRGKGAIMCDLIFRPIKIRTGLPTASAWLQRLYDSGSGLIVSTQKDAYSTLSWSSKCAISDNLRAVLLPHNSRVPPPASSALSMQIPRAFHKVWRELTSPRSLRTLLRSLLYLDSNEAWCRPVGLTSIPDCHVLCENPQSRSVVVV